MDTIFGKKYFSNIGIIIWILGFIGGIVLGNTFSTSYFDDDFILSDDFNTQIMIASWISSFLFGNIFMFFRNVSEYNDKSIYYSTKIYRKLDEIQKDLKQIINKE
jgi:hypothetical protein